MLLQCNGGMYPWGNQGQPPLVVQSDRTVQAEGAGEAQLCSCNPGNHANDGQKKSSVEHGGVANHQSQFNIHMCLSCCICIYREGTKIDFSCLLLEWDPHRERLDFDVLIRRK